MRVYRICKTRHAATAFDGEGARLYGGRWNSPGRKVVYTSENPALATLEILVHLPDTGLLTKHYVLCSADIDETKAARVRVADLPGSWAEAPPPIRLREIGDKWVDQRKALTLQVPSAVVDGTNYLLNPEHPDFGKLQINPPEPWRLDLRIVKGLQQEDKP